MQRILPRGEIESLDHTSIPRLRLPVRASVFADRAARLRQLATDNPAGAYLLLLAHLVDGQHKQLSALPAAELPAEVLATAQTHGMPPLLASGWKRDPQWLSILGSLLNHMINTPGVPGAAQQVCHSPHRRSWKIWLTRFWPSNCPNKMVLLPPLSWPPCRCTGHTWPAR